MDLLEKSQAAQKLLKVVLAGLNEDAHSEEVCKVSDCHTRSDCDHHDRLGMAVFQLEHVLQFLCK